MYSVQFLCHFACEGFVIKYNNTSSENAHSLKTWSGIDRTVTSGVNFTTHCMKYLVDFLIIGHH